MVVLVVVVVESFSSSRFDCCRPTPAARCVKFLRVSHKAPTKYHTNKCFLLTRRLRKHLGTASSRVVLVPFEGRSLAMPFFGGLGEGSSLSTKTLGMDARYRRNDEARSFDRCCFPMPLWAYPLSLTRTAQENPTTSAITCLATVTTACCLTRLTLCGRNQNHDIDRWPCPRTRAVFSWTCHTARW